jgi:hypothetical protein
MGETEIFAYNTHLIFWSTVIDLNSTFRKCYVEKFYTDVVDLRIIESVS